MAELIVEVLSIMLILMAVFSQVRSDALNHKYEKGDPVPLYVNVVGPFNNPRVEGDEELADNQEETGWKILHGDVFRYPKYKSLFAAAIGSGVQLLTVVVSIVILGLFGAFRPYDRGVLKAALVITYAITCCLAGFTSVSFYHHLEGSEWVLPLRGFDWSVVYAYCFYYYFLRSGMNGLMQTSFFFSYMACICFGLFLMLGTVGFVASLLFVRHIYGNIKCD